MTINFRSPLIVSLAMHLSMLAAALPLLYERDRISRPESEPGFILIDMSKITVTPAPVDKREMPKKPGAVKAVSVSEQPVQPLSPSKTAVTINHRDEVSQHKENTPLITDAKSPLTTDSNHNNLQRDAAASIKASVPVLPEVSEGKRQENPKTVKKEPAAQHTGIYEGGFGSSNGPSFVSMVRPAYPALARRFGRQGTVLLRLSINEQGRLTDVEVIERAGFGFDEAAMEAVKGSTYLPAKINNRPVASRSRLHVRFLIEDN